MIGVGRGRVLCGLAGRGILESRTPWMHEQEGAAQGLRLAYALFDFTDRGWADDELPRLLDAVQRIGFAGLNITFPFKQSVMAYLDELDAGATAIGAVNTVAFRDGRRIGANTDYSGFTESFRTGLADVPRAKVLQLGCGGAGAALGHAMLAELGVGTLLLSDPDASRGEALRSQLAARYGADRVIVVDDAALAAGEADGIVNATPVGMRKLPGLPLAAEAVLPRHWVADIVYFPLETALLAEARRKGCRTLNGSGMAVRQAADAFEIFTGLNADACRMHASFASFASFGA